MSEPLVSNRIPVKVVLVDGATGDAVPPAGDNGATLEAMLDELAILNVAIGSTDDVAGDPTVIGLLKQIAVNTTPVVI